MGVIEQEYKELRQLLKDYKSRKVTAEQVKIETLIYSQMEKRQRNAIAVAIKANDTKTKNALIEQNIIGNGVTIDLTCEERENETIRCLNTDRIITRAECLNYSGSHVDECKTCHHNKKTRKILLDGGSQIFQVKK